MKIKSYSNIDFIEITIQNIYSRVSLERKMSTSQIRKQWLIFSICYLLIYPLLSLMINLPQLFKLDLSQFNLLEKTIFY
ncbi:unknown protein [Simkania negevensis Z]|uniref:Uncharacterized protein n=1 Tax=Simkania negevensis (strain ATCC VR-1471 / DSM 27360 / Z) TaxID=331113 RepID=F8L6X6_SIMNZ|nr:unknown protein [Simkania negevensis Z]